MIKCFCDFCKKELSPAYCGNLNLRMWSRDTTNPVNIDATFCQSCFDAIAEKVKAWLR